MNSEKCKGESTAETKAREHVQQNQQSQQHRNCVSNVLTSLKSQLKISSKLVVMSHQGALLSNGDWHETNVCKRLLGLNYKLMLFYIKIIFYIVTAKLNLNSDWEGNELNHHSN